MNTTQSRIQLSCDSSDSLVDQPAAEPFRRPLRLGLLLNSMDIPRWMFDVLRRIQDDRIGEINVAVVRSVRTDEQLSRSVAARIRQGHDHLLYSLYTRWDMQRHRSPQDIFTLVSAEPLLDRASVLPVTPILGRHTDTFTEADISKIKAHQLDVLVRVGFRILRGEILNAAAFGVWSYHHGSMQQNRGGPPGFWEVMQGNGASGTALQVLSEELDAGRVLACGFTPTDRTSVYKNRVSMYTRAAEYLPVCLRRLRDTGFLPAAPAPAEWEPYYKPMYTAPTNGTMLWLLTGRAVRRVSELVSRLLFTEKWEISVHFKATHKGDGRPEQALYRYRSLIAPRSVFWADPHPIRVGSRSFVFFEEFVYSEAKAHIAVIERTASGRWTDPKVALRLDTHLSYPFVFVWNGELYMVPESRATRTVDLYRAVELPCRWEKHSTLLDDVDAVDATLAEIGGRWWMWVNVATPGTSTFDRLCLYHAETPLGPWIEHPQSPVKWDVRSSRPAGRVFEWNGAYYRPAQDCTTGYGNAIVVSRINTLSTSQYSESCIARLEPHWTRGLVGIHTISADAGLSAIDFRARRSRIRW